ncbi:hypothetical protein [Paraburkholderia terricola]|uniref:Uncharacterized protein n=1 Tax=Paraburkholderia terricola TaxID=169427 RepID=A0ABU1M2C3_9BURK|nr:hypothetical protein [Paraburkholderia terricola]MDR6412991.1 hypothetical protein [Paraburkholderia terricola]MDR6484813.1 hypothetical protein [Paraburkholderia terricola]
MKTHLKFRIGDTWVCVEDGKGYASEHPDHVTFAVREAKPDGKPGNRVDANLSVPRRELLAIALSMLELADRMTPETTWMNSETVGCIGQPLPLHFGDDHARMTERVTGDRPLNFARNAYAKFERLRARMPILRAAQSVLEHCDDETAAGLYVLIAAADQTGGLPARPVVGFDAADLQLDSDASTH